MEKFTRAMHAEPHWRISIRDNAFDAVSAARAKLYRGAE